MKILILSLIFCLFWAASYSALVKKLVDYKDGNTVLQGYLVYDDADKEKRPGILIAHEWWGVTPYIMSRAEQIAALGYVAFALDIYGKGIRPANSQEAGKLSSSFMSDRKLFLSRANAGLNELLKVDMADKNRIAAMGYCFGGGVVLEMARTGADFKGVVSIHGNLSTVNPDDNANIKGRVLVLHGGNDPFVNADAVNTFENSMRKTKVDWQVILYGGAVHSFSNPASGNDPSTGIAYNALADKRSWEAMKSFYAELFPM